MAPLHLFSYLAANEKEIFPKETPAKRFPNNWKQLKKCFFFFIEKDDCMCYILK